jgi:hypothetical protein
VEVCFHGSHNHVWFLVLQGAYMILSFKRAHMRNKL